MNRIINPHNAVAFYSEVLEEQEEAPLYSGHRRLPPWQIEFDAADVSGSNTVKLLDADMVEIYTFPGASIQNTATSDGKRYLTYRATTDLSTMLDEGMYRVKLTTSSSDTYFSHPICVSNAFQKMEYQVLPVVSGGGSGVVFADFTKSADMEANFEYNVGNGWVWMGSTSGSITTGDLIGSGAVEIGVRRSVFYPDGAQFYKQYTLSANTSGFSGASMSLTRNGGREYDNWCFLEFYNSTDLSGMGTLYQTGYKQRVYFHAAPFYPAPVDNETFIRNGQNVQKLQSVGFSEQINIDVYPVPDHLIRVIQSARFHDNVYLVTCADEKRMQLTNFQFTPRQVENDNKTIGRITAEINEVWLPGCNEDKTTV